MASSGRSTGGSPEAGSDPGALTGPACRVVAGPEGGVRRAGGAAAARTRARISPMKRKGSQATP